MLYNLITYPRDCWLLQPALQVFKFKYYVLTTCTIYADENPTAHTANLSLQEYKTAYC